MGFAPQPNRDRPPLSHRLTWQPPAAMGNTSTGTQSTLLLTVPAPDDAYAVRFVFAQNRTSTWAISKLKFAPSTTWNDYKNPTGSPTWVSATFDGAGADSDSIIEAGAATSFTVPAASGSADPVTGATNIPTMYFSDWVPLAQATWTSPYGIRPLMIRTLVPAQTTVRGAKVGNLWSGVPGENFGYDAWAGLRGNEDHVTSPDTVPSTSFGDGQNCIYAVQFLTRSPGVQLLVMGDSHQDGTGTDSGVGTPAMMVAGKLSAALGYPVMTACSAWAAQPSASFQPKFLNDLAWMKSVSVGLIQSWTANDSPIAGIGPYQYLSRAFMAAQVLRDKALAASVFITPYPRDAATMTGATLTNWRDIRARMLALQGPGAAVFDASPLLSDIGAGVLTGTYLAGLSDDQVHPNQTGDYQVLNGLGAQTGLYDFLVNRLR